MKETCTIDNLALDTEYWFRIRTADEAENWSSVSDTVRATTDSLLGDPVYYDVGAEPSALLAVGLNADNYIDLVVANWGDDNVTVLLNNGDGDFHWEAMIWIAMGTRT